MMGMGWQRTWLLALGLAACSASHGEQGNTSGSNWLRCNVIDECTAPEAARCSRDGYCLDSEDQRIPARLGADDGSSARSDGGSTPTRDAGSDASGETPGGGGPGGGGMPTRDYALCDGSSDVRLAVISEGGQLEPSYVFTNPYGHSFLVVMGSCHYYASSGWMPGIVEGDLSTSQAQQIKQRLSLVQLSQTMYHDLESCPDAGPIWVRAASGYADCVCGCDDTAPALVASSMAEAGMLRDELIAAGSALSGDVELFALDSGDTGAQPNDLSWPFVWPISEVSVTQQELFADGSIPKRRTLHNAEAGSARMLRSMVRARDPFSQRVRVLQGGKGYLLYPRDMVPAAAHQAIKQVMEAQVAAWNAL
jgi:hypothetical protein